MLVARFLLTIVGTYNLFFYHSTIIIDNLIIVTYTKLRNKNIKRLIGIGLSRFRFLIVNQLALLNI